MGGLTPARLQEHAFVGVQPGPGQPDRSHLCAFCDKQRPDKPHNGLRIDREPENTVMFPDTVTTNSTVSGVTFTVRVPSLG